MSKNSEYWEKRIASENWKVYNSLEEKNRELLPFYGDASEAVKDELYRIAEKYSKDGILSLSDMHKQNRLKKLNKRFESIIEELGHTVEDMSKQNMQQGFRKVYKNTAVAMGDTDFSMPNKKLMEKLLDTPWRGDTFSKRLWKNQKKLAVSLNDVLLIGLQQGKTVTEIAIMLHNRMGQGFNECHRLVRTETMHYLNDAASQRYKDSGIQYVQIWAARDERTCETCGGYHERIYPIDKCPHVPFHANCRCTILPVTDERMILEYEKKYQKDLESDAGKNIIDFVTGISKQKKLFKDSLNNVSNQSTKKLLEQSIERVSVKRASGRRSKYSVSEKTIYLSKSASEDTIAHELFHEIDLTYGLTENGMLSKSILSDYNKLQNLAKGYGKSIEEMLYSRYPKMFSKDTEKLVLKEEYRGISDILNGMSGGEINLGYWHDKEYWKKTGRVEAESFAQFGRALYKENAEVLDMFKSLFPSSYNEVIGRIEGMIK